MDLRVDPDADLAPLIRHLERDGLMGYPTETVYGLGGLCTPGAIARIRSAKGRPADKPLIALLPNAESAEGLRWTEDARELATIFWPGALTLVLEDPEGIFPEGVRSASSRAVAVRVSPHPVVTRLLHVLGRPITSTSLNEAGTAPATSGSEALDALNRLGLEDAWLVDGGSLPPSGPSTVVDCSGPTPRVLREGSVPTHRLRCAIPDLRDRATDS